MRVLTVNVGSSSVKVASMVVSGNGSDESPEVEARWDHLDDALNQLPGPVDAVAHRVVHGGDRVTGPTLLTSTVLQDLRLWAVAAPLHQTPALDAIATTRRRLPGVPTVVCPDTAFHQTMDPVAADLAVPPEWRDHYGVRRYGFHGLSVQGALRALSADGAAAGRVLVAHLGSGMSVTAVDHGRSVWNSMGFGPTGGLVMTTRSGAVDAAAVAWLVQSGVDAEQVSEALHRSCGLAALAGSADLPSLLGRAERGDHEACHAIRVFEHQLRLVLGAGCGVLGDVDAVILTGGVAENSPTVRSMVGRALGLVGVTLDEVANQQVGAVPDNTFVVSERNSAVPVFVVHAREDIELARGAAEVVRQM